MASNSKDRTEKAQVWEYNKRYQSQFNEWYKYVKPFSYDILFREHLDWASFTVQWAPTPSAASSKAKLLYGNRIPATGDNALLTFAHADLTIKRASNTQKLYVKGFGRAGDVVNRARFMPQQENIIGVKMRRRKSDDVDEVLVFDCAKFALQDDQNYKVSRPELRLIGSGVMSCGMSWNPFNEGRILSGSTEYISLWDLSAMPRHDDRHKRIQPIHVFKANGNIVREVQWHCLHKDLFGFVSDEDGVVVKDSRSKQAKWSLKDDHEHLSISFNPFNEWLLATGSVQKTVDLFDMRMQRRKLLSFSGGHKRELTRVEWDPNHEEVLASGSPDGTVVLWDQSRIGCTKGKGTVQNYYKNDPPELMIRHAGHKDWLRDFSWNKNVPWLISSVAEDKKLHVWKMAL